MSNLKTVVRRIPALHTACRRLKLAVRTLFCRYGATEQLFSQYAKFNTWCGAHSRSGPGSDLDQTEAIRLGLPRLLEELGIHSMLDIPCGDFQWMRLTDLSGIDYIGADIVADIVRRNQKDYGNDRVTFQHLDLMKSNIPKVDLVFCRDCLVHLSFEQGLEALRNIAESGARYLLTTTFTDRSTNTDIPTGSWRPLNLQAEPFCLPPPIRVIDEECTESEGAFKDKVMGLWEITAIADHLRGLSQ